MKYSVSASKQVSKCWIIELSWLILEDESCLLYNLERQSRIMLPVGSWFPREGKFKKELYYTCPIPSAKFTGQIKSLFRPEGMERAQECVIPMEWPPHGRKYQKWEEVSPHSYLIGLCERKTKWVICLLAFSVVDEKFDASLILVILSTTYSILLPYLFQEDFIFSLALVFWNSKKVCPGVGLYFSFTLLRILFTLKFWN